MKILEEINQKNKTTIMLVTHEEEYAMREDRRIHLVDGQIDYDTKKNSKLKKRKKTGRTG